MPKVATRTVAELDEALAATVKKVRDLGADNAKLRRQIDEAANTAAERAVKRSQPMTQEAIAARRLKRRQNVGKVDPSKRPDLIAPKVDDDPYALAYAEHVARVEEAAQEIYGTARVLEGAVLQRYVNKLLATDEFKYTEPRDRDEAEARKTAELRREQEQRRKEAEAEERGPLAPGQFVDPFGIVRTRHGAVAPTREQAERELAAVEKFNEAAEANRKMGRGTGALIALSDAAAHVLTTEPEPEEDVVATAAAEKQKRDAALAKRRANRADKEQGA